MKSLLPPGASRSEKIAERVVAEIYEKMARDIDRISHLWNSQTCPERFLPYLAWALNIEIWNTTWSVEIKRKVIEAYYDIRSIRGTREAILRAYELIGIERERVDLKEWYEEGAKIKKRFYFTVAIKGFANAEQKEYLRRVTEQLKPLRSKVDFTLAADAKLEVKAGWVAQRMNVLRVDWEVDLVGS